MQSPQENIEIVGTVAPLSWFENNGFYQVGQKIFPFKIQALQEATRTRQSVHWNFNDRIFQSFDWREPLNTSLLELYRLRALQLRQRYRYLMLMWSGGGDSTTAIEAFCDNGIHLDEVVCFWPISDAEKSYRPDPTNIQGENYASEWDFSIRPQIDKLRAKYPNLKLTIVDQKIIEREEYHDDTVTICDKHSYLTIQRWRNLDNLIKARQDEHGDGVATIWGISPIEVYQLDDWLATRFVDSAAGAGYISDYTPKGVHRKVEYFYWSPDLPELIREQGHVLLRDLNTNPRNRLFIERLERQADGTLLSVYEPDHELNRRWKKSLFYPNYPRAQFQVVKQTDSHTFATWETWFHRDPHAREFLDPWASAINEHQKLIDQRFMVRKNGKVISYVKCHTPYYIIGRLTPESEIAPRGKVLQYA